MCKIKSNCQFGQAVRIVKDTIYVYNLFDLTVPYVPYFVFDFILLLGWVRVISFPRTVRNMARRVSASTGDKNKGKRGVRSVVV